jgi:hypothetical protein
MITSSLFRSVLLSVGFILAFPAQAAISKYSFSGVVVQVDPALSMYVSVGTPYSGWFELDDAIPDSSSFSSHGIYLGALVNGAVSIGGISVGVSGGASQVLPSSASSVYNLFNTVAGSAFGIGGTLTTSGIPSWNATGWDVQLTNSVETVFSSRAFPSTDLITNLSLYDSIRFALLLNDGTNNYLLDSSISSLELSPVPEPGSYTLMLAGLGFVGFMGRRAKN